MAWEEVPPLHLKAGQEYMAALRKLGLIPEYLGWAKHLDSGEWILVMLTSMIETSGPLALEEVLFRAYNANATPKEISPFIVRVYGSRTQIAPKLRLTPAGKVPVVIEHENTRVPATVSMGDDLDGLRFESVNTYNVGAKPKVDRTQNDRRWRRFKANVEKLAA